MKGCYFLGAKNTPKFEICEMKKKPLGPHEVLVRNESCGICGTDIHIYEGGKGSADVLPPVVLGHEYAGVVAEIGEAVTTVSIGDHVALDPNRYCGLCIPCRMGKKQNCSNLFALGVNVDGGMAQYSVCPDTQCFKVNKEVSFDAAAMVEPLACAIHGVDNAQIHSGQKVLVIGGGTIGLLMVQLAKLQGASTVVLSEPIEMRRKIGLEIGADAVINPLEEDLNERFFQITGQNGADVIIECVGKPFAAEQAVSVAGAGATILLFSVPPVGATIPLPLFEVYQKELKIVGSMINPDTHQRAVNLINSKMIHLEKLITHCYGLEKVEEAIKMQMSNESIKVVVHPQE